MKCIAVLSLGYYITIISFCYGIKVEKYDCGSYYWSHVHELIPTCVFRNIDMKNHRENQKMEEYLFLQKNNLEALMINSTKNTVIPKYINDLPNLANLRIQRTDLKKLDKFISHETSKITFLYLGCNQISEIFRNAFDGLTILKFLYLNNNELSQIHNAAFKQLTNLEVIWLNDNRLKEVSSEIFSGNINLQRIKLQFNEINVIESNAFNLEGPNAKLSNLDLRGNKCIDLETFIFNITEVVTSSKCKCSRSTNLISTVEINKN